MTGSSKEPRGFIHTESIPWDSSWPELAEKNERHRLFSYLEERFGIPEKLFDEYLLFKRKKSWSIVRMDPHLVSASQLKVSRVGLKAFQKVSTFLKPTTRMIQTFGHAATRAKIQITWEQLQRLLKKGEIAIDLNFEKGYVIISLDRNMVLGLGFYGHGKLKSQIPRKELTDAMLLAPIQL